MKSEDSSKVEKQCSCVKLQRKREIHLLEESLVGARGSGAEHLERQAFSPYAAIRGLKS